MLKQRVITALVLVAILASSLTVAAPYGFPLFALALAGAVLYEWLNLLSLSRTTTIVVAGVMMFVVWVVGLSRHAEPVATGLAIIATVVWLGLAIVLFTTGRFPPSDRFRLPYAFLALALPAACWFGLVDAYAHGLVYLASIFVIVWAADIAAYFAGRAFGKRKLAPEISPGKTWAGAVGGVLAALVVALVCALVPALSGSWFAVVAGRSSLFVVAVAAIVFGALSIVGDLFESALKRQRGVKDSSHLLPGHGGVFDRVDALLPIVPLALLLARLA